LLADEHVVLSLIEDGMEFKKHFSNIYEDIQTKAVKG
jgi:hypothetical protein